MKVYVGCKKRVLLYKKESWYRQYVRNILEQEYAGYEDSPNDHEVKVAKLIYLLGAKDLQEAFYWEHTKEGYEFWSEQAFKTKYNADIFDQDYKKKSLKASPPDWI